MDFWLWLLIMVITKSYPQTRRHQVFWYSFHCADETDSSGLFYKDTPYWQRVKSRVGDQFVSRRFFVVKFWMNTRMELLASWKHAVFILLISALSLPVSVLLHVRSLKYLTERTQRFECYPLQSFSKVNSLFFFLLGQIKSTLWARQDSTGARSQDTCFEGGQGFYYILYIMT